ncbi:hypothetical protein TNCT_468881 [Trichonephila clavata]|uniref:HAT C-terminal dimerisation domain-containing protein n=1 Tax=Trichonephila clavata TaxID=2740835 RepID=A0A8X6G9M3_TRICU|nr:hypothetical protein TNCT_468881 [Trichonephila clavata]
MNLLLKVRATLPVTTASVERSFSTMKRIKNSTSVCDGPRTAKCTSDDVNSLGILLFDPEEVLDHWRRKIKKVTFLRCMFWRKINTDMNFAISRYFLLNIKNA